MDRRGRPRRRPGRRGVLAERLRQARAALSLTQETAAEAIGVSRVTLARWETGSSRPRGLALRFVQGWLAEKLGEEAQLGT